MDATDIGMWRERAERHYMLSGKTPSEDEIKQWDGERIRLSHDDSSRVAYLYAVTFKKLKAAMQSGAFDPYKEVRDELAARRSE